MPAKQKATKKDRLDKINKASKFLNREFWPENFADITKEELNQYDLFIVAFSGGKDSIASVLHLLELGVPKDKIELWHHIIDGKEGSDLMDWACTESYCKSFAKAMGLKLKFSWKKGGFEGEMLRKNQRTSPTIFEDDEDNLIECGGKSGNFSTRKKFPQVSADLSVRWCSAYLKISVCVAAINNQERFLNKKTMVISGERAEESSARSNYLQVEPDKADNRNGKSVVRYVDRCRPIHDWSEEKVWEIMKRWKINPHPAYRLGWSRLSCMACIFGSANQWASLNKINPKKAEKISDYEESFNTTIHRSYSVKQQIGKGKAYDMPESLMRYGTQEEYDDLILVKNWELPTGAFGENAGPQ